MITVKEVFLTLCAFALIGVSACSSEGAPDSFTLKNGVTLPVHESAKLQKACVALGTRLPENESRECVEFPMEPLREGLDPLEWYGRVLVQKGFDWASGSGNQHRFNWPTEYGCFLRLNASAVPKEYMDTDDWTNMKTYVAVFEFEDRERCE